VNKQRIVVLGSNSFVISSFLKKIKDRYKLIKITRREINLLNKNSVEKIKKTLKKNDIIIFAAAIAPVKNFEMLNKNLNMCINVYEGIRDIKLKFLINIGSDAVYKDSLKRINENSKTIPNNLHGFMHLMREKILSQLDCKICFTRSTLVYGSGDPHNSYGPNSFTRLAQNKKNLSIFGKGEEIRDHIFVDDIGEILARILEKKCSGVFNLVSSKEKSFLSIAKELSIKYKVKLNSKKRFGPIPHNGIRIFSNKKLKKIMKNYKFMDVLNWININGRIK